MKRILPGLMLALALLLGLPSLVRAITPTGTDSVNQNSYVKMGYPVWSAADTITAFAGGGQTSATQLAAAINRITVVATAGDSVKLISCSAALVGIVQVVINADAADAMDVFPASGESINALSANTALSVAANKIVIFVCGSTGKWQSLLTA